MDTFNLQNALNIISDSISSVQEHNQILTNIPIDFDLITFGDFDLSTRIQSDLNPNDIFLFGCHKWGNSKSKVGI